MLNSQQQQAVDATGHCAVIACPGSGKSRVIVAKTAKIIRNSHTDRVGVVTFTRDSAMEVKARIVKETGPALSKRSVSGTFHSVILRQMRDRQGKRSLVIGTEQYDYVSRALREAKLDKVVEFEDATAWLEAAKRVLTPDYESDEHQDFIEAYNRLLARNHSFDLFDLIREAVVAMRSGEVKPLPIDQLSVDEYQDTDELQYLWIAEHVAAGIPTMVVADDDQSIYQWRSALGYEGIQRFLEHTSAPLITLAINYRSHREIIDAAGRLIGNNGSRVKKSFEAARGLGGKVEVDRFNDPFLEAKAIVTRLKGQEIKEGEWAILARTNDILDQIQASLTEGGIPYYRPGGSSFWDLKPLVFMLSLLKSIETPDKHGLDQILHWAGMSSPMLHTIHQQMGSQFPTLLQGKMPAKQGLDDTAIKLIKEFTEFSGKWSEQCTKGRHALVISGVCEWMKVRSKDTRDATILDAGTRILNKLSGNFKQRLAVIAQNQKEEPGQGVGLYTMHGSKGLEFDHVWIVRAEEDVVPSSKSPLDEERRLMYVAMTRARKELIITSTRKHNISRFVLEAGLSE